MPSAAKQSFLAHIVECNDAIALYDHLKRKDRYKAEFNLRFVWIAAVSALDHYISELIVEEATRCYGNGIALQPKLLSEAMTFQSAIEFRGSDQVSSIVLFRNIVRRSVRYKSFQSPDKISDGLSYIWSEKHKWTYIAKKMEIEIDVLKNILTSIVDRRNVIAHNADVDESSGQRFDVSVEDAQTVVQIISRIVDIVDDVVTFHAAP